MNYEYKVLEAKSSKNAEELMNEMAKEVWRVISTIFWVKIKTIIIITFEREKTF